MSKTALLLSGGMDSLCLAWWKRPDIAFTLNYGQLSAETEIAVSNKICNELNIEHHVIDLDLSDLSDGDLVGKPANSLAPSSDWLPFRNQVLITISAMQAIALDVSHLMIGCVKSDGYHVDGSQAFVAKMNELLTMQEGNLQLSAPAIELNTVELVRKSKVPLNLLRWAHSCHKSPIACRHCRGCSKYFETWNILTKDEVTNE